MLWFFLWKGGWSSATGAEAEAEQEHQQRGDDPEPGLGIDHGLAQMGGLVSAHTKAMIQPTAVQPASRLSAKIATLLSCRRRRATNAGRK
jgi:hypothetical protein